MVIKETFKPPRNATCYDHVLFGYFCQARVKKWLLKKDFELIMKKKIISSSVDTFQSHYLLYNN